jgi:serine/threonine-protein kinase
MRPSMIGRMLSHYRLVGELGRGGMGVVYRAVDVALDREVALKVLPPESVADPERRRRFLQEAKAAAALEHPHIGVVYEVDEAEGVTFIAMELIRGERVRDLLARGALPASRAVALATQVAEGLAKAHERDRPPRSDARQRNGDRRRLREGHRLRPGQARRTIVWHGR